MKKFAFVMVVALSMTFAGVAQQINWLTFEEAIALQKKKPKKIMMDVYANWCGCGRGARQPRRRKEVRSIA